MIFVPAQAHRGAIEMIPIDPAELGAALERDASPDRTRQKSLI
jgi:hypothetical protein